MTPDVDLIIFDCDGTLTDSEAANNQAMLEVLREDGFTHYSMDDAYDKWLGNTASNILLSIQMETGRMVSDDFVPRYIRRVGELQKTGLLPVPGAPALVAAAKERFKICVASNGERRNVLESLVITGLMQHFTEETVFGKTQVKNPKPWPDLFLFAAEKMGVEPSRCLVIEDSGAGVRAGVAAGMIVWGFTGASHAPQKQRGLLESAGAHEVFSRLIHIQEKLGL